MLNTAHRPAPQPLSECGDSIAADAHNKIQSMASCVDCVYRMRARVQTVHARI